MEKKIPPEIFFARLEKLRKSLQIHSNSGFDSLVFIDGKSPGNDKTIAIVSWLLAGYNVADTIIGISQHALVFYTSTRKIDFLSNLAEAGIQKITFIKKDDVSSDGFKMLWAELHPSITKPNVGLLAGESRHGEVAEKFSSFLASQNHSETDSFGFLSECLSVKDTLEMEDMKKAGKVACYFFTKLVEETLSVIDNGKTIKHSELAATFWKTLESPSELKKCAVKLGLVFDYIDVGAGISIQSGDSTVKLFAAPDQNQLKPGSVVVGLGTLYRSFNSYLSRTLLIEPTEEQKSFYRKAETLAKIVTQNLRVGVKICDAYRKSRQFMTDNLPGIQPPRNFGFGIGVLLNEQILAISESNERVISVGNAFLINICFPEIVHSSKGSSKYAINLADIVLVTEKGLQKITDEVSKSLAEVSYSFDNEEQSKKTSKPQVATKAEGGRRRVQENTAAKLKNQKARNEHQIELKKKKQEELKARVHESFGEESRKTKIEVGRLECYKSREDLPKDLKKGLIYVDGRNSTLLLPVGNSHVPLHVALLKSVVKSEEGRFASLRFNFHVPHSLTTLNYPPITEPTVFLKEAVFRSQQIARITELEKQVKNLQKKIKSETHERQAKDDVVQQQKLNLNRGKRPILRQVYARPGVGPKKAKGILECHLNGFRWASGKGESVEIAFTNIRFAFIQPCQQQIIAAVHFKLKSPMLVGKKKTEDVQFYAEGASATDDVIGRGRNEDSDDQERQKEAKRKIDREFRAWAKSCEQFVGGNFNFEQPQRNEGFFGTTYRANVLLQPTQSCLINITEPHPFVLCLADVEIACFERMYGNARYFDLTIIDKDYDHNVRISSIEIRDVEKVKDWLDKNDLVFYDSKVSINWGKLLPAIRSNFPKFVEEDGGWTAWDSDNEDNSEAESDDGDSQFSASNGESSNSESSDEESESDFENEDNDDDSDSQEEDLSEEGLDWDEMEERAELEDRERLRRDMERQKDSSIKKKK